MLTALSPPPGTLQGRRYALRFATSEADLRAIQRMRFEVFNLELGEGLASSYTLGRDEDEYDEACHHLMVLHGEQVVGTYRLQTQALACAGRGFYSSTEFDLGGLDPAVLAGGVEVGRACVARAHRSGPVLAMLWQGLARYLAFHSKRYLFGCCSITTTERWVGRVLHDNLRAAGVMDPDHAAVSYTHLTLPTTYTV